MLVTGSNVVFQADLGICTGLPGALSSSLEPLEPLDSLVRTRSSRFRTLSNLERDKMTEESSKTRKTRKVVHTKLSCRLRKTPETLLYETVIYVRCNYLAVSIMRHTLNQSQAMSERRGTMKNWFVWPSIGSPRRAALSCCQPTSLKLCSYWFQGNI